MLRPEALDALKGVDLILHAGDIGCSEVLDGLRRLATVIAVRGNNDIGPWAKRIPEFQLVRAGNVSIYVIHDVKELKSKSPTEEIQVVVSGHSHRPGIDNRDGVLYFNPGSAGPRRFSLPVSVGRLIVEGRAIRPELTELTVAGAKPREIRFPA
jgi:hypothetical protein